MEMLHGKKLADSLEDELAEALGGDKDMANEFIARKRLGRLCCRYGCRPRGLELMHQYCVLSSDRQSSFLEKKTQKCYDLVEREN
jgi:hypothetical protein